MLDGIVWIAPHEVEATAPGLTAARLAKLRRDGAGPPTWLLSDRSALFDELVFRRWLESTVPWEWVHGPDQTRSPADELRRYAYQDAMLSILRKRTYVTPAQLRALIPDLPPWRINDLRFRGVGPRFLKPTPKTVIYVAEEALYWAEHVESYADPFDAHRYPEPWLPFTPPIGSYRPLTPEERDRIQGA